MDGPTTSISATSKLSKSYAKSHLWKRNIAKKLRQMGLNYISSNGQERPARTMRESCRLGCHYECSLNFNDNAREELYKNYWQMSSDERNIFYGKYIERIGTKRPRAGEGSRRSFSYIYHFPLREKRLQVCKKFFINTLGVSEFSIYFFYNKLDEKLTNLNLTDQIIGDG